jgi:Fe-S cluster assembly iron-binding protein IscA
LFEVIQYMQNKNFSKRRRNKKMMTATEKATEKLKENLLQRCIDIGLGFRLISDAQDPSKGEFSIKVDHKRPGDRVIESHGIRIYLNSTNAIALENYELDYVDEPGGGFCLRGQGARHTTSNLKK